MVHKKKKKMDVKFPLQYTLNLYCYYNEKR